jgi:hypothetical protein
MFLALKTANTDLPPIGFCVGWLLGCSIVLFCVCLLLCAVCGAQVRGSGLWLFVFGICIVYVLFWL